MSLFLTLTALLGEIFILASWDKKRFGSWYTPFSVTAFPYFFVVLTAALFSKALGFIAITPQSVIIWIVGLFFFWLAGRVVKRNKVAEKKLASETVNRKINSFVLTPAVVSLALMALNFYLNVKHLGGIDQATAGSIFSNIHHGILSISKIASMTFLVILIGTTQPKKIFTNAVILLTVFALIMYQVKGDLLIPLAGGLIFRLTYYRVKITTKNIILILISAYLLFNLFYMIVLVINSGFKALADLESYKFLNRHFITYLFSGVLSLSSSYQDYSWHKSLELAPALFSPFINLFRHLNGTYSLFEPIRVLNFANIYNVIDLYNFSVSNVNTFMGTIVLYLGWFYGLFCIFASGVLSYVLYYFSKSDIWIKAIFSLIAGALFFGWFEYYFWHAFFILSILIILIIKTADLLSTKKFQK